jgi:hypothetical protein
MHNGKTHRIGSHDSESFVNVAPEDGRVHLAIGHRHGDPSTVRSLLLSAAEARTISAELTAVADALDDALQAPKVKP